MANRVLKTHINGGYKYFPRSVKANGFYDGYTILKATRCGIPAPFLRTVTNPGFKIPFTKTRFFRRGKTPWCGNCVRP